MLDDNTLDLKKKAIDLHQKVDRWIKKIGSRKSMEGGEFHQYMNRHFPDAFNGISYSTINDNRRFLKSIFEQPELFTCQSSFIFEKCRQVLTVNKFIKFAEKFYDEQLVNTVSENQKVKKWYLYFLAVGPHRRGYPKLGRGLLTVNDNEATLQVPDEKPNMPNYKGILRQLNNHIFFFDLEAASHNPKRKLISKELHIKINCGSLDDNYIIGSYNTFDKRIYTGSVILQKVPDAHTHKNIDEIVSFMSRTENSNSFDEVPEEIKEYLSSKRRNITKIPRAIVQDEKGLRAFLENNRTTEPTKDNIENRFLEPAKPIIFLASPQTSIGSEDSNNVYQKYIKYIIENLKNDFSQYEIYTEETCGIDPYATNYLGTLRALEKTRYFILLLPETIKLSYSIIQLGWAMQVSKYILFIYPKNKVSRRLKDISFQNNNFIVKKRNLSTQNGRKEALEDIYSFIRAKKA